MSLRQLGKRQQKRLATEQRMHQRERARLEAERRLVSQAREMFANGHTKIEIMQLLGKKHPWVSEAVRGMFTNVDHKLLRHKERVDRGMPLINPWLDPMDEANVEGYVVPTPQEIEERAAHERSLRDDTPPEYVSRPAKLCPCCRRFAQKFAKGICDNCAHRERLMRKALQTRDDSGRMVEVGR